MSMRRWRFLAVLSLCVLGNIRANPADLDTTFNSAGGHPGTATASTMLALSGLQMSALGVAVQSDGNIVVVGGGSIAGTSRLIVARVTPSGALDTSFGTSGSVAITIDPVEIGSIGTCVALQSDGKIVIGGYTANALGLRFSVVRLTSSGQLDTGFNGTGIKLVTIAEGEDTSACGGVVIQPDGKIVASGFTVIGLGTQFAAARLNIDGTLDETFNGTGTVATTIDLSEDSSQGNAVALAADNKIVISGTVTLSGVERFAIARLNTDGTVDITFSTQIDPGEMASSGKAVAIQPDGKIVEAGTVTIDGSTRVAGARFNEDGSVDATFETRINPDEQNSVGAGVVLQADGKIVIAGMCEFGVQSFAVARFNSDTSLDTTVQTIIDPSEVNSFGAAVALQADQKIVVAGKVVFAAAQKCGLARYDTSIVLDTTFNGTGTEALDLLFYTVTSLAGNSVAVQPNGAIIVAGVAEITDGNNRFAVARFLPGGLLDTSFKSFGSVPGVVTTSINVDGISSTGSAVALQGDGKIVVAGSAVIGGQKQFALARFKSNGTLDETFNAGGSLPGTIATPIILGEDSSSGTSVALQQDGKIVVAGSVDVGGNVRFAVARFNANGTLDTTFTTMIDPTETRSEGLSVALQPDGKIVVAGCVTVDGVKKVAVARFWPSGAVESRFTTMIDAGETGSLAASVVIQSDGKIVVAGSTTLAGAERCALARFNSNGSLDTTFNGIGTVSFKIVETEVYSNLQSLCLQQDGKMVVAGFVATNDALIYVALARLKKNGLLDGLFGNLGTTSTYIEAGEIVSGAFGVTLQSDGKIVTGGMTQSGLLNKMAVARFMGNRPIPQSVTIFSWLKTIYADGLGFAP